MVQIGAALSGFALFALFKWMPIWDLAQTSSATGLFRYFVVVMMLLFGVFMVSGGRSSFSFARFVPAFVAGMLASAGWAIEAWWLFFTGILLFGVVYVTMGE